MRENYANCAELTQGGAADFQVQPNFPLALVMLRSVCELCPMIRSAIDCAVEGTACAHQRTLPAHPTQAVNDVLKATNQARVNRVKSSNH